MPDGTSVLPLISLVLYIIALIVFGIEFLRRRAAQYFWLMVTFFFLFMAQAMDAFQELMREYAVIGFSVCAVLSAGYSIFIAIKSYKKM